jgi:hypothetical protein
MQGVRSQEQAQVGVCMPRFDLLKCVDRVARSGAVLLQFIDAKRGLAGDGQRQHLDTLREGRQLALLLVRRTGRGNEQDLVEAGLLAALLRHDQVPQVDRIKRAAENADTHGGSVYQLETQGECGGRRLRSPLIRRKPRHEAR